MLAAVPLKYDVNSPPSSIYKSTAFEALWLDLFHAGHSLRIILIYRPPNFEQGMPQALLSYIESSIAIDKPTAIFGDLNYPNIFWEGLTASTQMGQDVFHDQIVAMGFQQIIMKSTRGENILDIVLVNF